MHRAHVVVFQRFINYVNTKCVCMCFVFDFLFFVVFEPFFFFLRQCVVVTKKREICSRARDACLN